MGCNQSKKKSIGKQGGKEKEVNRHQDGGGKYNLDELDLGLEKQLERFEWQLKILKEVLLTNGSQESAELLKGHAHGELCALVQSITDKVRTETSADLTVVYEERSKSAAEEHQSKLEELQRIHVEEKTALSESHQTSENVLKARVDELTAELHVFNELKKRVQDSTFKKDLQRNIQAHGSPGPFWESEQESLLFVIEMKTERVQEQGSKLYQMQTLEENNQSLESQLIHVHQQNEDLRVRIDNYQSLIQQLSKEQNDRQGALERQTVLSNKLSQEKEQLMFKLRHRDSCPTIHIPPTIMPEVVPR
ncbi:coiled-coil domain-containing protein 69 [Aplochiton taeniatus]